MERRRGVRFEIQLTCRLKRGGAYETVDATTLNLGRLGALVAAGTANYMDSKAIPEPGDMVDLEVLLPAHQQFGQRCLACEAVTVRATRENGHCLIALQFQKVEIRKVLIQTVAAAGRLAVM
jgi:hypothetical protein